MSSRNKSRVPFSIRQVTKERIDKLLREIRKKTGENYSYPEFMEEIVKNTDVNIVEQSILKRNNFDINLTFDGRKRKK